MNELLRDSSYADSQSGAVITRNLRNLKFDRSSHSVDRSQLAEAVPIQPEKSEAQMEPLYRSRFSIDYGSEANLFQ